MTGEDEDEDAVRGWTGTWLVTQATTRQPGVI
jgi:hypothetical protein